MAAKREPPLRGLSGAPPARMSRTQGSADAYPFPTLPALPRLTITLAAVGAVFLIGRVGGSAIDSGSHFLLLGTAVLATAWFAGTGPALAATVLGALMGAAEARDPSLGAAAPMHLAIFVVQGLLLTALVSELRGARRAAEEQGRAADAARRKVEAASRMKDEFLATVSHELRTPLNAALGWLHLLRTGKLDPSTVSQGIESVERNVRLQARVTADLLDVSKALTGELQLECEPTRLADAVQQAVAAVAATARAKGVSIHTRQSDGAGVIVLGDQSRLRQVAWHLLGNAIKFTPRGGRIDVAVDTVAGAAELVVRDNGEGIDPQFLPFIFDRFTQADASTTRNVGGLGVGLALVHELVELHGGEIEARNAPAPGGAIFTVRLPLQPAEAAGRPAPCAQPLVFGTPPLNGIRVLVLDQNQDERDLLRTVLLQRGASVRTVSSVAEALELLEGWRPDILVTDSLSPGHDSYELVGKVQSLDADRGGRIPALALTTFGRTDERLAPLLAGVHRDLSKPVEPALLTAEIARLTGRERRRVSR